MRFVSREELYAQVWSKPMTKLAADYGVTGTALKKTCNRHHIPTPPLGYWAKLEHGKPVTKPDLPALADPHLQQIRVIGNRGSYVPEPVKSAKAKAKDSLARQPSPTSETSQAVAASETAPRERKDLVATRRAIAKARPDGEGFAEAHGQGVVSLKIAPASVERTLSVLTHLFDLAETQGYRPQATESSFVLMVEDETISFTIEEQAEKTLHEPTAAELRRRDERARWGSTSDPWPKYDRSPSGRLAVVIATNPYSGLRRTYGYGKTRSLEQFLADVLSGFAEHAAQIKERRREEEERTRAWKEAERRRRLKAAFEAQEKRRMAFANAVHEQLIERTKLSAVLSHIEGSKADTDDLKAMMLWLRRRIRQIDSLISPQLLDISCRSAKINFAEPRSDEDAGEDGYFGHLDPAKLQLWTIDEEKGLATAVAPADWLASIDCASGDKDGDSSAD